MNNNHFLKMNFFHKVKGKNYSWFLSFQDIFVQNIDVKWDDIIGLDHAKRLSKEAVVYPIKVIF